MSRGRAVVLLGIGCAALIGATAFWAGRAVADRQALTAETLPVVEIQSTVAPATTVPTTTPPPLPPGVAENPLPPGSGDGRRIVFSGSAERMWWVESDNAVVRTAPVSGQVRNPVPGTYSVYSRTELAAGLDGSRMNRFVRFTKGPNGWAIGFHSIPTLHGEPVQTEAQLGQPLSHGCIRQAEADAAFTWEFAPVGSVVVVVA